MIIRAEQHKNRCHGYIVKTITEDGGYGRVRTYWNLLRPNDGEIIARFKSCTEDKNYSKNNPFRG